MSGRYQVEVQIGRQEDGLWRVEVPGFHGCWVDAPTLAEAIADIQEGVAMAVDDYNEQGWQLPSNVTLLEGDPERALLPVIIGEHHFIRRSARPRRVKQSTR